MVYERAFKGKTKHFILMSEVDLVSDAVWGPGQGDRIRTQAWDLEESKNKQTALFEVLSSNFLISRIFNYLVKIASLHVILLVYGRLPLQNLPLIAVKQSIVLHHLPVAFSTYEYV